MPAEEHKTPLSSLSREANVSQNTFRDHIKKVTGLDLFCKSIR
jgi:hypothetical protein